MEFSEQAFRWLELLIERGLLVVKLDLTTTYARNLYPIQSLQVLPDSTIMLNLTPSEASGEGAGDE